MFSNIKVPFVHKEWKVKLCVLMKKGYFLQILMFNRVGETGVEAGMLMRIRLGALPFMTDRQTVKECKCL